MFNRILNYFKDPEDNDPSFIRLTRNILIFSLVATLLSIVILYITSRRIELTIFSLGFLVIVEVVAFVYANRGDLFLAKLIIPLALVFAITIIAINANTLHDISIIAYPLIIIIANLLQGRRSLFITTPLVVGAVILLGVMDITGLSRSPMASKTGVDDILVGAVLLSSGAGVLNLLVERLRVALARAEGNEQAQKEANTELKLLQESLEQRVAARTAELEFANQHNEKRAKQFEAVAQLARTTTTNQNLETLLPNLVELISKQFGFYHAGVFLIDEKKEFAELRAANSGGGKRMLARRHKLGIGQSGIVGYVSGTGRPRIALNVGADAAFFNNPDLPDTHSEMALPLKIGDQLIGVLDIQSIVSNAFQEEDIDVLSTLADQVSIAIQNARSYETLQELLSRAQKTSTSFIRESWKVLQTQEENIGYQITENKLEPLSKLITSAQIKTAMASKVTVKESGENATLAIPIRLRDQVIGVMDIRVSDEHEWDPDEIDVAEAVAERLSLALEASLLLKSTQRQAEIERITTDISTKIGASTQFDSILRTAAEELSRVLGGSEVLVQIQSAATEEAA
jgi:GAF domain-containing protein